MARAIKLIDAPIGLFEIDGILVLKTEYSTRHEDGTITPDCYIIESGEYFWGGVDSVEERNNLEVAPVDMPTLTPPNEWVSVEERLPDGNGEYIVTACDEGCPAGEGIWYDTVVVFAEYYDGCWTWNDGTEYDLTDIVTHWMPPPAPPNRRPPER